MSASNHWVGSRAGSNLDKRALNTSKNKRNMKKKLLNTNKQTQPIPGKLKSSPYRHHNERTAVHLTHKHGYHWILKLLFPQAIVYNFDLLALFPILFPADPDLASQFLASSCSTVFAIVAGSVSDDHRSTTCPCLSTKNFSKFHLITFMPKLVFFDFSQL